MTQILLIIVHMGMGFIGLALLFDSEIGRKEIQKGNNVKEIIPGRRIQNASIAGAILVVGVLYNLMQIAF